MDTGNTKFAWVTPALVQLAQSGAAEKPYVTGGEFGLCGTQGSPV